MKQYNTLFVGLDQHKNAVTAASPDSWNAKTKEVLLLSSGEIYAS